MMRSRSHTLSPLQQLPTSRWIETLNADKALLVQVGANDHAVNRYGSGQQNHEPAPFAVKQGWRAILFEPAAESFRELEKKYRNCWKGHGERLLTQIQIVGCPLAGSCSISELHCPRHVSRKRTGESTSTRTSACRHCFCAYACSMWRPAGAQLSAALLHCDWIVHAVCIWYAMLF